MPYTKRIEIHGTFDDIVDEVVEALNEEGFGVLSDIDFQATFANKLGEDIQQYRVLGACHPPAAFEGVSVEPELGALLPCNVAIHETADGTVVVSAVDPSTLIGLTDNPDLDDIVDTIDERFDRVLDSLSG
ncbi:DUF302 domain-containing protein [Halanaeroarchaeum sulfurireducens]|uniref:DUF302 domain-containing protein n=1 Tax=Halanaeroarchaeum sulfurireducens TaxID=1604004 RepID=A0A0F7P8V6_9EURY|nr:DUF302 domain-containing protein [Halanaeroarchaeum sulfurireducens]AKH97606.1 hypothetical protein HLASF_1118 [Halanaeroarchaeum sulfurireducens]ALG82002.1 hypothetical protein HLASA_1107 [Halanaeroarchaeum sulfurireducens]